MRAAVVTSIVTALGVAGCGSPIDCGSLLVWNGTTCACAEGTFRQDPPRCELDGDASSRDAGPIDARTAPDTCAETNAWRDEDEDGYGDPAERTSACGPPPAGYVANMEDCDDTRSSVNEHASEVCDDLDNDCDSTSDESLASIACYTDADLDGIPVMTDAESACQCPEGTAPAPSSWDCSDGHANVFPGQTTYFGTTYSRRMGSITVNSLDYDCDGTVTKEPPAPCHLGLLGSCTAGIEGPASYDAGTTRCTDPIEYIRCNADCTYASLGTRPLGCR